MDAPIFVVEGDGPSLFGQDRLTKIRLDWHTMNAVERGDLTSVLDSHTELFVVLDFLTVIHVNTRSLLGHLDDVVALVVAEHPHILALSET